jgi:MarR family transcriptional regulator, organic hydroperoxide resistance regulator
MKRKEEKSLRALAEGLEMQLHAIRRRMRRRLNAEYARGGVTGPQRLVMQALVESGAMSLKELSAKVDLAHSTVSGIVHRLEKRGFLNRQVLESDRRMTQITLSKAVRDFLEQEAPKLALHPLLSALQKASEAERAAVRKGIETLERLLEE